jgi:hypothetical protein
MMYIYLTLILRQGAHMTILMFYNKSPSKVNLLLVER